jgi:hypothetical protein
MSAYDLRTDAIRNIEANAFAGACLYMTLLKALTLQSATSIGAATFSVDLAVATDDILVFDQGLTSQEAVTVLSVTGSGPYTVTPTAALTKAHLVNARIAHLPRTSSTIHEVTVTRVAANWGSPSPAGTVTAAPGSITVPSGNVVGSIALFSASTSGTYYESNPVTAQDFTSSGGAYTPAWVETFS